MWACMQRAGSPASFRQISWQWGLCPGCNPSIGSLTSSLKQELMVQQLNSLKTSVLLPPCLKLPFPRALTVQFTALGTRDGAQKCTETQVLQQVLNSVIAFKSLL